MQRVQDQIHAWRQEERWEQITEERRRVLSYMSQVLGSCYTLLDSTQIPVDGIVRLLQHILRWVRLRACSTSCIQRIRNTCLFEPPVPLPNRPQQQELQMWASQLLLGKACRLDPSLCGRSSWFSEPLLMVARRQRHAARGPAEEV